MTNKYTLVLIGLVGIYSLAYVMPSVAEDLSRKDQFMAKRQAIMEQMYTDLNLSEEQQGLIKQNRDVMKAKKEELRGKIKAIRTTLREELEKEQASKAAVDTMANELVELISQRMKNRIDGIWAVKAILSPEQFKTFQQKKKEFKDKNGMHKYRKGGGS